MALAFRNLSFRFRKAVGTFANGSSEVAIPTGLQASVRLLNAGLYSMPHCQVTIWGLTQSIMNDLSTLGVVVNLQPANPITVFASDNDDQPSEVFRGEIWQAIPDYNRQPEAPIWIDAYGGLGIATPGSDGQGYTGDVDVVGALRQLCQQAGYAFEPNGVTGVSLKDQYLYGSPRDRILTLLGAIQTRGISGAFVEAKTVAIWPQKGSRSNVGGVPIIAAGTTASPGTMIGYPSYTNAGLNVRCLYNPTIRFGAQIQIKTSLPLTSTNVPALPSADGLWTVQGLSHELDSQISGGKWETVIEATRAGYSTPIIATATAG